MGHSDWKIRKEALEEVVRVVETNKRVKPNIGESFCEYAYGGYSIMVVTNAKNA